MSEHATAQTTGQTTALSVENLSLSLALETGLTDVVSDLNFSVEKGRTLCIIGESGSGKTLTALSLIRLLPPVLEIKSGSIRLEGTDLAGLTEREMADLRGSQVAMIFQEPMTSLNPVMKVGKQIAELVSRHRDVTKAQAMERAVEMLRLVGLPNPERQAQSFPHQMSGGMRQRAMIAMALVLDPPVLIADEPTTALDVSVQAEILKLIRELQGRLETSVVMITHDFGVVAEVADDVTVMYAGRQVETASVDDIFDTPLHPYTKGLMGAAPGIERENISDTIEPLAEIPGTVPRVDMLPAGCAFAPRCPIATERCRTLRPELEEKRDGHKVACWEVPA